jgi:hypothetical protein
MLRCHGHNCYKGLVVSWNYDVLCVIQLVFCQPTCVVSGISVSFSSVPIYLFIVSSFLSFI